MKYPFSGIIVRYVRSEAAAGPSDPMPKDELHVNLWEMVGRRFIDIGVMINSPEEVQALQVDLPWKFDRSKVFDLGSRLVGERIVAAIFNEVVCYNGSNDQTFAEVTFPTAPSAPGFILGRLSSDDFCPEQVLLSDGATTTRLRVRMPPLASIQSVQQKLYVRFRIVDIPEANYTSIFYQKDRNLLSSSLETRIVDFRINVRRGIPDDVLTSQTNLRFPRWKKIHFFLTLDRVREMTFSSENFVACRSLEDEAIWNSYIALNSSRGGPDCSVSDYLGYQWTVKASDSGAPAKDLVALARFSQVSSSLTYMMRFIVLALIIGAAGNGVWNLIEQSVSLNVTASKGPATSEATTGVITTWLTMGCLFLAFVGTLGLTTATVRRALKRIACFLRGAFSGIRRLFQEEQ